MDPDLSLVRKTRDLVRDLALIGSLEELYRRAVGDLVGSLGFDRARLSLFDEDTREVRGTWATDTEGRLFDDSARLSFVGELQPILKIAQNTPDRIHITQTSSDWEAMALLENGSQVLGWFEVDNSLGHRPLAAIEKEVLVLYSGVLGSLIQQRQHTALIERYRQQNALKDKLFTILAHDLRGPIGNLSVTLGFACDQPMDHDTLMGFLKEGRQEALRTYNLLENVLGWVRSQIEEVAALRERIAVNRTLEAVQLWLEASAKAKGIHLLIECPKGLTVMADERMVETIVRNLVSNAIKFSPRGATITLRGRTAAEAILIEVEDLGTGIAPEKLVSLFTGQQKKSQPGTSGEGGSGLGLMFSSDLAKTLGGRLEAQSTVGKGSLFRLVLPDQLDGEL